MLVNTLIWTGSQRSEQTYCFPWKWEIKQWVFLDPGHAPQQAHTMSIYAIQGILQVLAFPLSISVVLWKHLQAEKMNADIPVCDMLSSKILPNQGIFLINSVCTFYKYPNWAKWR